MNACSSACGHCGRCDDGLREGRDDSPYLFCDACGKQIYQSALSLAGVGVACSRVCMDILTEQHARILSARATFGAKRTA
jgi:hypothetical protein